MQIIGGLGMHACSPHSIGVNENRFDDNALVPRSGYLIERRLLNKMKLRQEAPTHYWRRIMVRAYEFKDL